MKRLVLFLTFAAFIVPGLAWSQSAKMGLPVIIVHGICSRADDFLPLEAKLKGYLQAHFPTYYPHAANGADEYVAYYSAPNVVFQLPGTGKQTYSTFPATVRFFVVALDDPGKSAYQNFDEYSVVQQSIETKGDELAHIIWKIKQITGAPRVIVIVHSMGGLVARTYIEEMAKPSEATVDTDSYYNDIATLITIDTPHGGSIWADGSLPFGACGLKDSPDKDQMAPNSSFLSELNYEPGTAVASALPAGLTIASIVSTWSNPAHLNLAPLVIDDTDNIVSGESQDITQNVYAPMTNSQSELAAEPNSFGSTFFSQDGKNICGIDLILHGIDCTGYATQTVSLVEFLAGQYAQISNTIPVLAPASTVAVGTSMHFTATTASGKPAIWSLLEGGNAGMIDQEGTYYPPSYAGTFHAVAIDPVTFLRYGMMSFNVVVDKTPPTMTKWSVTPVTVIMGGTVTGTYTVSDTGASGLTRAELWRVPDASGKPSTAWVKVFTQMLSGNGPAPVTLTDVPTPVGKYWYQTRVFDRAKNETDQSSASAVTVIAAKPLLAVSPASGPQGTTFTFSASGLTPNNGQEGYVTDPTGTKQTMKSLNSTNAGTTSWSYASQCGDALGKWTAYALDFYANLKSNTVTATLTTSTKCNPVPTIKGFTPASLQAGSTVQKLTVNGTGFVQGSTVTYNGKAHTPAYLSTTSLSITLTAADLATMGSYPVVVTNPAPGGGISAPMNFTLTAPNVVPTADWFIPSPLVAGSAAQRLAIHGTGFLANSTVKFNGLAHVPVFTNSTLLTISLTVADLAKAGNYPVVVTNPAPGGGPSSPAVYLVLASYLVPTVTGLLPSYLAPGSAAQTLTINGIGFFPTSTVKFNGIAHSATYLSATSLTIALSKADLAKAGSYPVVVTNPKPGGGSSIAANFNVSVPPITWALTVSSSNPANGVAITASPADNLGLSSGATSFTFTYNQNTQVTLAAPSTAGENGFSSWTGCDSASSNTCTVTVTANRTVTANYAPSTTQIAHFSYAQSTVVGGLNGAGVAVDGSGNLFVIDSGTNTLKEVPQGCTSLSCVKTLGGGIKAVFGSITVDGAGNLIVTDVLANACCWTVQEFHAADGYSSAQTLTFGGGDRGIAVDGDEDIFAGDSDGIYGNVVEWLAAGGYSSYNWLNLNYGNPGGVALDGSGNAFVTDSRNGVVQEFLAESGYTVSKTIGRFMMPYSIAVDGGGNVFVVDVTPYSPTSYYLRRIKAAGGYPKVESLGCGFGSIAGVAADASGDVFLTDNVNSQVVKLETLAVDFGTVSIGQKSATIPLTFTFDSSGTLGSVAALTGGATGQDFAVADTGRCIAGSYNPSSTCTVGVTFAPMAAGLRSGTVVLKDGNGNVIAAADVHGTGTE